LFLLGTLASVFYQNVLPDLPKKETNVYDDANLLFNQSQKIVEKKLFNYSEATSTEIVVVTITSIGSTNINMFGAELSHKWGIGQKGKQIVL
jgi:uncharacterized protein